MNDPEVDPRSRIDIDFLTSSESLRRRGVCLDGPGDHRPGGWLEPPEGFEGQVIHDLRVVRAVSERARQATEKLRTGGIQLQEMAASMDEVNEVPADLRLRLDRALRDQLMAIRELRALANTAMRLVL